MTTSWSHEVVETSSTDMPSEILEHVVSRMPKVAGILALGSVCTEFRHKAEEMADGTLYAISSLKLPAHFRPATQITLARGNNSLRHLYSLLLGLESEDGSSTLYLDPQASLLCSQTRNTNTPASAEPLKFPENVSHTQLTDAALTLVPRHLSPPLTLTPEVEAKALRTLVKLGPLFDHFPALGKSSGTDRNRVLALVRGVEGTTPGWRMSMDLTSVSTRKAASLSAEGTTLPSNISVDTLTAGSASACSCICFEVSASALHPRKGFKTHKPVKIPGSKFPTSLHLDTTTAFVSPLDVTFPFAIPEGQATFSWVVAKSSQYQSGSDKVFAQCDFGLELCSVVNLSTSAKAEERNSMSLVPVLGTSSDSIEGGAVWTWDRAHVGKMSVKGKDGWAANNSGQACVYGTGTPGLYLDSLIMRLEASC